VAVPETRIAWFMSSSSISMLVRIAYSRCV
jgi:hypothetical protein